MDELGLPDFSDEIVLLYLRAAPRALQDGVALEEARFEQRGGRLLLCGVVVNEPEQRVACRAAVCWDDVSAFVTYTPEVFREVLAGTKPTLAQKMGL